jgi:uncharacterized protein (DUF1697 family)
MTTYAAFLRGINVGGAKKVPMADLRTVAQDLGYTDVATYINSGNLVFASTKKPRTLEKELAAALEDRFGFGVDVCVRSSTQLRKILAANPYPDGEASKVTVAFLASTAPASAAERLAAVAAEHEPFVVAGTEVYVHYGRGLGTSELAAQFAKLVGVSATVRNVGTVTKVLALLDS